MTNASQNFDDTTGGIRHPDPGIQPVGASGPAVRPEGISDEEWEQRQRDRLTEGTQPEGIIDGTDEAPAEGG